MEILNGSQDWRTGQVTFYRRDENDVIQVRQMRGEWCSFHKELPPPIYKKYINWSYKELNGYYKVGWKSKDARETCCKQLGESALEADLTPMRRIMTDAEEIVIQTPRRLFFDLETDSRVNFSQARLGGARILSWAAADDNGNVFSSILKEESDEDEYRIVKEFWEVAQKYDLLLAWNGEAFDFEIIKERTRMLGAFNKNMNRWLFLDHMLVFKKNNLNSAETADQKISLKLNDIAQSVLGEGKHDLDGSKVYEIWKSDPKKLEEYNRQDARLMPLIEKKTKYIDAFIEVCKLCRVFPETNSLKPTRFVEGFLLALGSKLGHHFKSKWYGEEIEKESVPGAYVRDPSYLGIHKNIAVADFKSLYPSIIRTFNMSPETKGPGSKCPVTGVEFINDKDGILCLALDDMGKKRKIWADKKDAATPESDEWYEAARLSMAIKVISNSFYGVLLNEYSRFYDKDIGESITTTGAHLIKEIIKFAEECGMEVIYGDTDSIFVNYGKYDFKDFVEKCNEKFCPDLVKSWGCTRNFFKLEFEKEFSWLVFSSDGRGKPVKKRYVGQIYGAKKPKFMGLALKRGDSCKITRDLLSEVIGMLCSQNFTSFDYEILIRQRREKILKEPLALEDIQYSKSISRCLADYKVNAPHVRIGKILEEEGEDVLEGTRINYFVLDGSVSPLDVREIKDYTGTCDRAYYWEHAYPDTMRLLAGAFPNHPWHRYLKARSKDRVLKGQLGLF